MKSANFSSVSRPLVTLVSHGLHLWSESQVGSRWRTRAVMGASLRTGPRDQRFSDMAVLDSPYGG